MRFFLVSIAILTLGSSYFYYLEYAEKKRSEKLHSTVLSYCKKIGFDNRDSKVNKLQRSYANCFSFFTGNKESFLDILRIRYKLEYIDFKEREFNGDFINHPNPDYKKIFYEDLINQDYFTKRITNKYKLIEPEELEKQPLNSLVQINDSITLDEDYYSRSAITLMSEISGGSTLILRLSHKFLNYDQFSQIAKRCPALAFRRCPAKIYIEVKKCEAEISLTSSNSCMMYNKEFEIVGIKFLKMSFAEFVSKESSCRNNYFFSQYVEERLSDFELMFGENFKNKPYPNSLCAVNDYNEIVRDIPILNKVRQKYPFILEEYNKIFKNLGIQIDPVDGGMKLSEKGKRLSERGRKEADLSNAEYRKKLEDNSKKLIEKYFPKKSTN